MRGSCPTAQSWGTAPSSSSRAQIPSSSLLLTQTELSHCSTSQFQQQCPDSLRPEGFINSLINEVGLSPCPKLRKLELGALEGDQQHTEQSPGRGRNSPRAQRAGQGEILQLSSGEAPGAALGIFARSESAVPPPGPAAGQGDPGASQNNPPCSPGNPKHVYRAPAAGDTHTDPSGEPSAPTPAQKRGKKGEKGREKGLRHKRWGCVSYRGKEAAAGAKS